MYGSTGTASIMYINLITMCNQKLNRRPSKRHEDKAAIATDTKFNVLALWGY